MEHHFNVGLAKEYGIEESILIHNLYYWINNNVANKKHFHDERYWTYNTADAFAQLFPYMNSSKIYRVLKSLEDKNIIIKWNFNEDKHDRTNWYSFTNDALAILKENGYEIDGFSSSFQNDEMHFSKMENGICENEKCYNIYIDNIPNINTNNKHKEEDINISSKKEKDILSDYDTTDVPEGFLPIIKTWCEYKRDRKQKYKSQKSFQTMVNHLHKLSKGNPHDAKLIVEQSIGNNYAGLFELSNKLSTNNLPLGFKLEDDRNEIMKNQPKQSW